MNREERRRRKRIKRIVINVIVLVIVIIAFTAIGLFKRISPFRGQYTRTVDFTQEAVTAATLWLSDVEGAEIGSEYIMAKSEGISANVILEFDGIMGKGSFKEELSREAYDSCVSQAYNMTAVCLRDLIFERLIAVGYSETMSEDEVDALIKEALGMTLDNYIRNSGVVLMPAYEEIEADYNRSGDYKIKGSSIEFTVNGEVTSEHYAASRDTLAMNETGKIYRRVEK